jgi:cell division protein ZapA
MSDKFKIKLTIADRVYPLTVEPHQEEGLRRAAKTIENLIKQFEHSYAVRDKQDVLAMCALQFASKLEQKSIDKEDVILEAEGRLKVIHRLLQEQLSL